MISSVEKWSNLDLEDHKSWEQISGSKVFHENTKLSPASFYHLSDKDVSNFLKETKNLSNEEYFEKMALFRNIKNAVDIFYHKKMISSFQIKQEPQIIPPSPSEPHFEEFNIGKTQEEIQQMETLLKKAENSNLYPKPTLKKSFFTLKVLLFLVSFLIILIGVFYFRYTQELLKKCSKFEFELTSPTLFSKRVCAKDSKEKKKLKKHLENGMLKKSSETVNSLENKEHVKFLLNSIPKIIKKKSQHVHALVSRKISKHY
jgi:ATP-dependent Zn protease